MECDWCQVKVSFEVRTLLSLDMTKCKIEMFGDYRLENLQCILYRLRPNSNLHVGRDEVKIVG